MAKTTTDVIISYDIEKADGNVHDFVKKGMEKKGYFDAFIFTNDKNVKRVIYLPNTTLWKQNAETVVAYNDLKDCLNEYSKTKGQHELEKVISTAFSGLWIAKGKDATTEEIKKYPERN